MPRLLPGRIYELRFILNQTVVNDILSLLRHDLVQDPSQKSHSNDGALIHSVYLDTPSFSTFFEEPYFHCRRFKLRRYGEESIIWLEYVGWDKMRVRQRRISVDEALLADHLFGVVRSDWEGAWFRQRLHQKQLRPVCQISCWRRAYAGITVAEPFRMTIDRHFVVGRCSGWGVAKAPLDAVRLLPDQQILSLKFKDTIPDVLTDLIEELKMVPKQFSTYRESVAALLNSLDDAATW